MSYRVLNIDTAGLTPAPAPLVEYGTVIDEVHVLACPAVGPVLMLGSNGDLIPLFTGFQLSPCGQDASSGLLVRAPSAVPLNGILTLLIWTGGAGSSSGNL
jgi:hypothetical protein